MLSTYRKLETNFLQTVENYPAHKFDGRGIVTACGSGECYYVGAYVLIKLLREFGCNLPVEVWKFSWEKHEKWDKLFNDLENVVVKYYHKKIANVDRKGWSLKPFAILESNFREVLFLDSDIIPTKNPEYLFDYEPYQRKGAIFWSDTCKTHIRARPTDHNKSGDAFWHLADCEEINEREFESGQVLINKEQCWKEINLTCHYNNHADWYYKLFLGDKETFHLAWRRLRTDFVFFQNSTSINIPGGKYFYQYDYNNDLLFQHRSGNKLNFGHVLLKPKLLHQERTLQIIKELKQLFNTN